MLSLRSPFLAKCTSYHSFFQSGCVTLKWWCTNPSHWPVQTQYFSMRFRYSFCNTKRTRSMFIQFFLYRNATFLSGFSRIIVFPISGADLGDLVITRETCLIWFSYTKRTRSIFTQFSYIEMQLFHLVSLASSFFLYQVLIWAIQFKLATLSICTPWEPARRYL